MYNFVSDLEAPFVDPGPGGEFVGELGQAAAAGPDPQNVGDSTHALVIRAARGAGKRS